MYHKRSFSKWGIRNKVLVNERTDEPWTTMGNAGIDQTNNFIGTTDKVPVNIRSGEGSLAPPYIQITPLGQISFINNNTGILLGINAGNSSLEGTNNIAIGDNSLLDNTNGMYNIGIGGNSLKSLNASSGMGNIAIGLNSLSSCVNTMGSIAIGSNCLTMYNGSGSNTAIGFSSLSSNNGSGQNTTLGYNTLSLDRTGFQNIAIGSRAMSTTLDAGFQNVAIGTNSLNVNRSNMNVCIGYNALLSHNGPTGNNTAVGYQSLSMNVDGFNNTAFGYNSLGADPSGSQNVAIGTNSMGTSTGNLNTAVGCQSLQNNSGSNNTCIGYQALNQLKLGTNNIAIGYQAGINLINDESNNIHIGNPGLQGDNEVIRIGTQFNTACYIGGIIPALDTTLPRVFINDLTGQLFYIKPESTHSEYEMQNILLKEQILILEKQIALLTATVQSFEYCKSI